jgi:alpha-amylase
MRTFFFTVAFLGSITIASAKKVKFAVDMTGLLVNSTGVHISGDFQTLAGSGPDWASNTTVLTQETADTNIYSIVVDIPAFAKYEYKFLNGDMFYEAEFVPVESRVMWNFDDNRWIFVDSLANDTTFLGAIPFAGNAPKGQRLLRVKVDMINEAVSGSYVHVAGSFQSWSTTQDVLYSFNDTVYEAIAFVDSSITNYTYRFLNGSTAAGYETVPGACSTSGNRSIDVTKDTVLSAVCFSSCSACVPAGIHELASAESLRIYPNPMNASTHLQLPYVGFSKVILSDVSGRKVREYTSISGDQLEIQKDGLEAGIYFISASAEQQSYTIKLIVH